MPEVELTQGLVALYDEEDADLICAHKWHAKTRKNTSYAATNVKIDGRYRWRTMHRLLLQPPVGMVIDHINGNGLDNRRCNLRVCTQAENMRNRRPYGKSQYLGVALDQTKRRPWRVTCGKRHIGGFETEVEAALAYDAVARVAYGSFARLNFPHFQHEAAEAVGRKRKTA